MAEKTTVYACNISPDMTEDTLRKFFAFCGTITAFKILKLPHVPHPIKYSKVTYETEEQAKTAILLNGTQLLNMPIVLSLDPAVHPVGLVDANAAISLPTSPPTVTSPLTGLLPPPTTSLPLISSIPIMSTVPIVTTTTANSTVHIYSNPSMSMNVGAQKAEEVARTVYVGNLNPGITPEHLVKFFGACGPVTFCRMAGDDSHPARFAFIEFETLPAAQAAMTLNGTILMDRPIKVNHSKNPIVKPPPKPVDVKKEEEAARALRRAQEALNKRLGVVSAPADGDKSSSSDDKSRKRSRSRSRSPRDRDRRRSPRPRSRSPRPRSRERRDRDRDRRSRSRSRERRERDRRDRDRDRSDRDRDRSDRDKERDRDRDREREREREKDREKEKEWERNRDKRDRERRKREEGKSSPDREKSKDDKDKEKDKDATTNSNGNNHTTSEKTLDINADTSFTSEGEKTDKMDTSSA